MATPQRGEVWLIDFGLAGKVRPALVISVGLRTKDRSLITVASHTTSLRRSSFEIAVRVSFLKSGAFLVQGVTTFPTVRALHRLGSLRKEAFEEVLGAHSGFEPARHAWIRIKCGFELNKYRFGASYPAIRHDLKPA